MGSYQLEQVQCAQGGLDAAIETYEQALDMTAAPGERHCLPRASKVGMVEMAYQRDELDVALWTLTEGSRYVASSFTSNRWPSA